MIENWLNQRLADAGVEVAPVRWNENREWAFNAGRLSHVTGGFFSVRGTRIAGPSRQGETLWHSPMIDQPEVGLLAFLVHQSETGPCWLLQAKAEPGATGIVQVGPSVQATRSNYLRLHGGSATAYLDLVQDRSALWVTRIRQSEQGNRFLSKYNLNAVRLVEFPVDPVGPDWTWAPASALREALAQDFAVNTDARSVIASTDWSLLSECGGVFVPRHDGQDGLRHAFARSYAAKRSVAHILGALARRRRASRFHLEFCPLDTLPGWEQGADRIVPADDAGGFEVRSVSVSARCRERPAWQQPLLKSRDAQTACLYLAEIRGQVRVFLAEADEPGFGHRTQLGPSWQSDRLNPFWCEDMAGRSRLVRTVAQSDEGGRFMDSVMHYQLCWLDDLPDEMPGGHWVNLAQLQTLCATSGIITNEGRSAVSVLLSFA